jgi:hypothetical protein
MMVPMTRKPKPKPDDPEEYKRFLETAKKIGASDDPKDFDRAFERVVRPKSRDDAHAPNRKNRKSK